MNREPYKQQTTAFHAPPQNRSDPFASDAALKSAYLLSKKWHRTSTNTIRELLGIDKEYRHESFDDAVSFSNPDEELAGAAYHLDAYQEQPEHSYILRDEHPENGLGDESQLVEILLRDLY